MAGTRTDENGMMVDDEPQTQTTSGVTKRKGRGFQNDRTDLPRDRDEMDYETFESGQDGNTGKVQKSVEGYIVVATNIHEESTEEDVTDLFAEYGAIKNLHLNLDRRTGYVKGYVLVEYEKFGDAKKCVEELNGKEVLGQILEVDFAVSRGSVKGLEKLA